MKTPIFTGSGVAICTPFCKDGIDLPKLGELIDFQIENGTAAIIVCGTTGESSTQTIDEHISVVDFAVKHAAGRIKIIAGTGSNDTQTAVHTSRAAEKAGVDGLLLVTPYYNRVTQKGLIKHYNYIADRVNLPIILYNVPSRTTVNIEAETYKALSAHPNIIGTKEASGDFSLFAMTKILCDDDFYFWSGNDDNTVPMMALGACGLISVAANIIPRTVADMCAAALAGDFEKAAAIQLKYGKLFSTLFIEVNPTPVKAALNLMGKNVGSPRLPLCDMEPEHLAKLKAVLSECGVIG